MKKINKNIIINANREKVWDTMLGKDSYRVWTVPFSAGSYYIGELAEGNEIRFLGPDPESGVDGGMIALVDKLDMYSFISFKHIGFIMKGVEDYDSEEVKKWTPAFENYTFEQVNDNETKLIIDVETADEYYDYMNEAWDKSLAILKSESEK